jgi:excisionase family DNA binding protein
VKRVKSEPLDLRGRLTIRPEEAARTLGVSERKFREMLPELPHVRHRGVVLIPVDALREWLRAQVRIEGNQIGEAVEEVLSDLGINHE